MMFMTLFTFSITKTSLSNGNWNNPGTWIGGVIPTSGDKIKINHSVTLNTNFVASDTVFVYNCLNLSNNSTMSFSGSGTIIFVGDAVSNGRLGTVGNNAGITGNMTSQKWVSHCDGTWSNICTPFNATLGSLDLLMTGINGGYYYPITGVPVGTYTWENTWFFKENTSGGYVTPTSTSQIVKRGQAFWYWYSSQTIGPGSSSTTITQWNFPRKISASGSITLSSTFNFSVTYTPAAGNSGFNLVGNPYPGTIDWLAGGAWTKTKISSSLYVWNGCTDTYATYVGGVGVNGGSRYISHMQGFFIRTTGVNPVLSCDKNALVNQQPSLLRTSATTPDTNINRVLRVTLGEDEIAIRLDSTSTLSVDSLTDGVAFLTDSSRLYSHSYSNTIIYSVNALPDSSQTVPLGTRRSGIITFNGVSTFSSNYTIMLKDLLNNTTYTIYDGYQYIYNDTILVSYKTRFEITFIKNIITSISDKVQDNRSIYYNDDIIYVKFTSDEVVDVIMYDMIGREVYRTRGNFTIGTHEFDRPTFPVILYIYGIGGKSTKKIF